MIKCIPVLRINREYIEGLVDPGVIPTVGLHGLEVDPGGLVSGRKRGILEVHLKNLIRHTDLMLPIIRRDQDHIKALIQDLGLDR